jgi:hypothetical protein
MYLSGERVSNAWVTYPFIGDNLPKGELIPDVLFWSHDRDNKGGLYV